jgi:hypothetical protein
MKATFSGGELQEINNCYIDILGKKIISRIIPDISDTKNATYTSEAGMGRSMPFKNYTNSDDRTIGWTAHYVVAQKSDIVKYLQEIQLIQSALYPRMGADNTAPFAPPPICKLSCGALLQNGQNFEVPPNDNASSIRAVMKSYSIKYDTSVPWDDQYLLPYKFDIDMSFEVVYDQSELPGQERIMAGDETFGAL